MVSNLSALSTWPFPTKDNPLTPWTPKEQKDYEQQQRDKAPEAPF